VEEKKKKKEEEEAKEREKEKELELNPPEENEAKSDAQLSEVKERLDKLEETVKEIAVVTKKQSSSNIDTNQVTGEAKEPQNISAPSNTSGGKDNSLKSKPELDEESKGSVVTPNSSLQDTTGQNQSEKSS
jgi:hypothetical protein